MSLASYELRDIRGYINVITRAHLVRGQDAPVQVDRCSKDKGRWCVAHAGDHLGVAYALGERKHNGPIRTAALIEADRTQVSHDLLVGPFHDPIFLARIGNVDVVLHFKQRQSFLDC
jgi:hypothetical protein